MLESSSLARARMDQLEPMSTPNVSPPTSPVQVDPNVAHWQRQTDLQHLKLLSIFYYVFGGLQAFSGCVGLVYVVMGAAIASAPPPNTGQSGQPPPPMGWIGGGMALVGGCLVLFCALVATLNVMAGVSLGQ